MSTALAYDPVRSFAPAMPAPVAPAPAVPAPEQPAATPARPAAQPAGAAAPRPRGLAAAALVGVVACVVGAQLVLSIGTAESAYRLSALQQQSEQLAHRQAADQEALRSLAAPQRLAARAAALGMVPDDEAAYLDARTGRVLGSTVPAEGRASAPGGIVR
ncbi:hypothetical protein [Amnibacterium endophyticum]|uniref:Cell division protein FtsL n=1 Tax=Amnibacterium endophyticum TaxID=2109337 RepID=A0ABW4LDJ5_9MICO